MSLLCQEMWHRMTCKYNYFVNSLIFKFPVILVCYLKYDIESRFLVLSTLNFIVVKSIEESHVMIEENATVLTFKNSETPPNDTRCRIEQYFVRIFFSIYFLGF